MIFLKSQVGVCVQIFDYQYMMYVKLATTLLRNKSQDIGKDIKDYKQ